MELYAGLDLHSRNTYIGIMDDALNRVFKKRVFNDLDQILHILEPFKKRLEMARRTWPTLRPSNNMKV